MKMSTKAASGRELPKYKSHKTVWALKIAGITFDSDLAKEEANRETNGSAMIVPVEKDYVPFKVKSDYVNKHLHGLTRKEIIGGYYVVYEDNYESWSPAKAFEEGYTLIK